MFAFGDKSSDDFGLLCTQYTLQNSTGMSYDYTNILGKKEPEITYSETFQPVPIVVEGDIIADDVLDRVERIKGWLHSAGTGVLVDERQPNRYRTARVADAVEVTMLCNSMATLRIRFICSAFLYNVENEEISITENGRSILNGGTVESEPVYKLHLLPYDASTAGKVNFFCGANYMEIDLTEPEHYNHVLVLDTVRQAVYYDDTKEDVTGITFGIVPPLPVGESVIYWDNPLIERVALTKNERFI